MDFSPCVLIIQIKKKTKALLTWTNIMDYFSYCLWFCLICISHDSRVALTTFTKKCFLTNVKVNSLNNTSIFQNSQLFKYVMELLSYNTSCYSL